MGDNEGPRLNIDSCLVFAVYNECKLSYEPGFMPGVNGKII